MKKKVRIIGGGLAGSEASYQLAKQGFEVELYEMRPHTQTPAHESENLAELVCSNSFRSDQLTNAAGLLKEEMRQLDSLIIKAAESARIPAGSALAVDRAELSAFVEKTLNEFDNITIIKEEIKELDPSIPTIIATGPLTSDDLSKSIKKLLDDESLYFYDAVAPIVDGESINFDIAYRKSRYDKGDGKDYINCPMTKDEFDVFHKALLEAELAEMREFEDIKVFEACMPIETMAKRGIKTLTFGPLKPVGLEKEDGTRPYAVVQLRQDNAAGTLYNLVGFQTRIKWNDQKRIIQMIPGLENVEIVRYGVMHRNTFINAPTHLNEHYQMKDYPNLFFAGQITGVEGYVESSASGLYAALNMAQYLNKAPLYNLSKETIMGSMASYVASANPNNFQPMNANFGLVENRIKDREVMAKRSLEHVENFKRDLSQ
ncbi:MAG TPA: methylenetetrahydrofolate--tRNA-(uracil(54)-C(5))-methyltransferase (FADH(2)-oxidizing) TrmFO [Erysipelothrix sp.]|nr:methylenetetrahydrofolate--tRNA-(uracil(54)-C(5))-methyltransferase (FADH(2)-oxidizing) TrmFO [Erysipelothrix sp.]